jgi:hypothetical protein
VAFCEYATNDERQRQAIVSGLVDWPKIRSFDPSLTAVWTAYPSQPLLALFDPPVQLASSGPRGCLNLEGRIHFPAIRFAVLIRIEIPHI